MNAIANLLAALRALPKLPALVERIREVEGRQRAIEPAVELAQRVTALERNLDEVEALAREVNIGKPTRSRDAS